MCVYTMCECTMCEYIMHECICRVPVQRWCSRGRCHPALCQCRQPSGQRDVSAQQPRHYGQPPTVALTATPAHTTALSIKRQTQTC